MGQFRSILVDGSNGSQTLDPGGGIFVRLSRRESEAALLT